MQSEFIDLKARLKGERALVNRFRIDCAVYKTSYEDLDLNFSKVTKESEERETYLKTTLSKLKIEHETLISVHNDFEIKFDLLTNETIHLFEQIKKLEDNNLKSGQYERYIGLLIKEARENPYYNVSTFLGFTKLHSLEMANKSLNDFIKSSAAEPKE